MVIFLCWSVAAMVLTGFFTRVFRRAPYHGVPDEALRFYERLIVELAKGHPEIEVIGPTREGFGAVLRVERQELAVPMGEVFLREKAFPDSFPATVERLVRELRDHLASIEDLLFDEAIDLVLPQIRAEEWIRGNSPAFGPGALVRRELFEGLDLCFVIDEGDSMVFVTEGHLRAWGIDAIALENLSMTNLRRLAASDGGLPVLQSEDAVALTVESGDGYDAARVLLALDRSVEDVESLVFAMPDRDKLVVARRSADLATLMQSVEDSFEHAEHPISPRLFAIKDRRLEGVEEAPK
ncbi:MAG TPA: hypothetical protein PKE00_11635 [Planctomycetota bacterium]|nr:hypothetical protein [Planctomycetota bacterium]